MKQHEIYAAKVKESGYQPNLGTKVLNMECLLLSSTGLILVSLFGVIHWIGTDDLGRICFYGGLLAFGLLIAVKTCLVFKQIRAQVREFEEFYQNEYKDKESDKASVWIVRVQRDSVLGILEAFIGLVGLMEFNDPFPNPMLLVFAALLIMGILMVLHNWKFSKEVSVLADVYETVYYKHKDVYKEDEKQGRDKE